MVLLFILLIACGAVIAVGGVAVVTTYFGASTVKKVTEIANKQIKEKGKEADEKLKQIDEAVDSVQDRLGTVNEKMEQLRKKMAEWLKQVTDIVSILETTADWMSFAAGEISLLRACYVYSIILCTAIVQQHFLGIPLFCCVLESPVVLTLAVLYFERSNSNKGPLIAAVVIVGAIAVSIFLSYSRSAYVQFQIQSRAFFNDLVLPLSMLFVAYLIFAMVFPNCDLKQASDVIKNRINRLSTTGQKELNKVW